MTDRIWFPGNPWPDGHRIRGFDWDGRLDHAGNLWFNLEFSTAPYAETPPSDAVVEPGDWTSPDVWRNYHGCSLTTYDWANLRAGTPETPFRFTRPHRLTADPLPPPTPECDPVFALYLLGHDSCADHEITFTPETTGPGHRIDWTARIALTYAGEEEFRYGFRAVLRNCAPGRIAFPENLPVERARELLARVVDVPDRFTPRERGDHTVLAFTPEPEHDEVAGRAGRGGSWSPVRAITRWASRRRQG